MASNNPSCGASPVARIEQLKEIEQDVVGILESAGLALQTMTMDRPNQKQVDTHNQQASDFKVQVDVWLQFPIFFLSKSSGNYKPVSA